jgi:hypothetical protein
VFILAVASSGTPTLLHVVPGNASINDLGFGPGGVKVLTGNFSQPIDFGFGPLVSAKEYAEEGYVVKGPLW